MASIFLSYARDDAATAARIAAALESAGHSVWWDKNIGVGARFSAEIEEALRAAELVVVLWSKTSVKSAWVQDEAASGRDSGRLVPVLIEKVEPPLGFRQYQAVDLAKRGTSAAPLVVALGSVPTQQTTIPLERASTVAPWRMISVVLAAMVIVVGGWWLWPRQGGGSTTIAVAAAAGDNAVRSRDFARSIANDLGRYRAGPAGAPTIIDGNSPAAGDADYRVEVGVSGNGPDLRAEVSLQPPGQGRLLWSSAVEGQGRPLVDLRQEVAASVGDVLRCLAELQASGKMPSQEVKALYLNGCAKQEASEEAISIFRQITRLAPKFGPGWAGLAALETWSVPTASEGDRPALLSAIREHLRQAEALAPEHPDTIAAKAAFRPGDAKRLPDALAVLDRGLQRHPESAVLHRMRAERLLDTGRMRDAVAEARRASELNPLSPAMRDTFISALAYSGQSEEAFQLLKKADSTWPGSALLRELRFRLDLRFGDPRDGLQSLAESGPSDTTSDPANQAWRSFLEARAEPTPARIESGLAVFRARYARDNGDVPGYLQALGTFGKIDDAYRATEPALAIESLYVSTHVLFRPYMRSFRADPRFILLSARLGLLQYWRKTGLWPDFCSDPRLPYDCAKEAAKLTPAQLVPAPSHQLTGTPRAAKR